MIDLHMHTTCSDGQFSPEETIQMAADAGVTVAAITDHDTASGVVAARAAAEKYHMTFFTGVEISVQSDRELHILGYGIDPENAAFLRFCQKHAAAREKRSERLLIYLRDCGVAITMDDVKRCNGGKTSGRPHFARALVELGYAESVADAFAKYLTTPEYYAHVERPKPTPAEGIEIIQNAGGVAVLAHPHQLRLDDETLEQWVIRLKEQGLQGIEAYYSKHTKTQTAFYLELAKKYDLLYTCGSDFHGSAIKPEIFLGTGIENRLCIHDNAIPERLSAAIRLAQQKASSKN